MPPGARKRRAARRKQQQQQHDQPQQQQSEDSQPNSPHPQGNGHDLSSDQSDEDRMESNGVQKSTSGEMFLDAVDSPLVSPPPVVSPPAEDFVVSSPEDSPPAEPPAEDSPPAEDFVVSPPEDSPPAGDFPPAEDSSPEDSPKVTPVEPAVEMAAIPVAYLDTVNEEVVQAVEDKAVVSESVADAIVVSVVEENGGVSVPETVVPVPDEAVVVREVVVEEEEKVAGGGGVVEEVNPVPLVRHRATIWNCCGLLGVDG